MDKTDLPVWVNSSQLKLKAISDETRRVILGLLEADGPQFQIELAKKLKISASLATYHLNLLVRASLVKREYTERRTGGFSKYTITQEGSNFLDSLGIRQELDQLDSRPEEITAKSDSIRIIEQHISPMVLPREIILGWVRWECKSKTEFRLEFPNPLVITEFTNVNMPIAEYRDSITIPSNELLSEGFLGFVARYDSLPESDTVADLHATISNEASSQELVLETKIVRPLLEFKNVKPRRIKAKSTNEPVPLEVTIENLSMAEAVETKPELIIESGTKRMLEIVNSKPTLFFLNPLTNVEISGYPSKIIIKGQGKTTLRLRLHYKDRMGNVYLTEGPEILVESNLQARTEVPVNNVMTREESSVHLPGGMIAPLARSR